MRYFRFPDFARVALGEMLYARCLSLLTRPLGELDHGELIDLVMALREYSRSLETVLFDVWQQEQQPQKDRKST